MEIYATTIKERGWRDLEEKDDDNNNNYDYTVGLRGLGIEWIYEHNIRQENSIFEYRFRIFWIY